MFRRLDPAHIVETARQAQERVTERFPDTGLRQVAVEVVEVTERAASSRAWFAAPHWPLRIGGAPCIILLLVVFSATIMAVASLPASASIPDVVQAVDAFISEVVFLGLAMMLGTRHSALGTRLSALGTRHSAAELDLSS